MKELMRKGFSLLLFDFSKIIVSGQINDGSTAINYPLNRWLLIYDYWFRKVPFHFGAISFLALLGVALINPYNLSSTAALVISAAVIFLLLIFFLYLPLFAGTFIRSYIKYNRKKTIVVVMSLKNAGKRNCPIQR
ncbi:hypothetical protein [Parafilimonas terrae]|uniref:Uncharacterized protein n=1 Tax=Parafilimonas terrae TaxID=1465490 RepID=A0A1I5R7Q0_9BACT|nr:hypothetical protein [Parafilimonas terrae]SFP54554.1 hypothetical protein SAMN05444277_101118 [Parafilimonas terrae]